ncbi:MAG: EAL domain-containing protein [Candidatus Nanopelagicales bacterium]
MPPSKLKVTTQWVGMLMAVFGLLWWIQLTFLNLGYGITAVTITTGVGVGAITKAPRSVVPSLVGTFLLISFGAFSLGGSSLLLAVAFAAILTGQTGLVAWTIIRTRANHVSRLDRLLTLTGVAAAVAILAATAASIAVLALTDAPGGAAWRAWFVGTFAGAFLAAPGILSLSYPRRRVTARRAAELAIVFLLGAALVAVVLGSQYVTPMRALGALYLLVPMLLWFAVRFGLAMTAFAACAVNLAVMSVSNAGMGPVAAQAAHPDSLLLLQLAMLSIALIVYSVAVNTEQRRASEHRLESARGLLDALVTNSDAMISIRQYSDDAPARYVLANPRFAAAFGRTAEGIVGLTEQELTPPDVARTVVDEDRQVLVAGQSRVFISRGLASPNQITSESRVYLVTKFPIADGDGLANSVGSIALDITDQRRRERLMRLTFDQSPVPMVRLSWRDGGPGDVLDANASLASLLGVPVASIVGSSLDRFIHPDERGMSLVPVEGEPGQPRRREARLIGGDGSELWVVCTATVLEASGARLAENDLEEPFALLVLEDVTARRVAEQTLTHQALHDALTGSLNRYALVDRLSAALSRLWRSGNFAAVIFCDLDGFKNLNDTLGHRAGDEMLVSVSERLRAVMRPQDAVARLGGDEFVLICEDLPNPGQARLIGERIREAMRAPFRIHGRDYGVTVSVGIAATTDPETRAEDLLRRADLAMYRAKDNGRNRVEFYVEELEQRAVAKVESTEMLRRALAEGRIAAHYQPIVDLATGVIVGVEALARLIGEQGELIRPADFIAVAESTGMVGPLGEQILDMALDQQAQWAAAGYDIHMNVNVSPRQLARASFAPAVFERLMTRGIAPKMLCLEVTEGAVVDAKGPALITLRRLRSYGVQVGIDDFGTGYSSLTTLKYVAADVLKIDRTFVEGVGEDPSDSAIVSAVINVAHDLGRVVVAEGVETAQQAAALTSMGCDQVQGFHYGRPVAADQITELLGQQATRERSRNQGRGNACP